MLASLGVVLGIAAGVRFASGKKWHWTTLALLSYFLFLAPTFTYLTSGIQPIADRFTYLPMIPLALLAGAGLTTAAVRMRRWSLPVRSMILFVPVAALLGALAVRSVRQVSVWKDSLALWSHAVLVAPGVPAAYSNLGLAMMDEGLLDDAILSCAKAIDLKPDFPDALNNMGAAYYARGDTRMALDMLLQARDLVERMGSMPYEHAEISYNLGLAYWTSGDTVRALQMGTEALGFRPEHPRALHLVGVVAAASGRDSLAGAALRRAAMAGDRDAEDLLRRLRGWGGERKQ
jgi:TPR repeat protein